MSRLSKCLLSCVIAAGGIAQSNAACDDREIGSGDIAGFETDTSGLRLGLGAKSKTIEGARLAAGSWKVTAEDVEAIRDFFATIADPAATIGLFQTQGDTVKVNPPMAIKRNGEKFSVCVPQEQAADSTATDEPAARKKVKRGRSVNEMRADCKMAADQWSETRDRRYRVPVLFNRAGVRCYSPPVVRVGDLLVVGMYLESGETMPEQVSVEFTNCPQESTTPEILASGEFPELQASEAQMSRQTVVYLDARACGGESPVVSVSIGTGDSTLSNPYTLSQYKRYRATFHLGAVYTDLHQPDFDLRDEGGTDVIFNSEPEKRGPEYVAALVVQGIGHYFRSFKGSKDPNDTDKWPYKGRDPIHDGSTLDRFGFVMSAGVEHPGERFGVGLAYEIAYGVNLVGLYEMAKIKQLRGFEIGDEFTGEADAIPTGKEWEAKFSIGLTFDLAYATKLFTGAKSGG